MSWITGGVYLPGNQLALVDFENNQIVLFDREYNVTSTTEVKPEPEDIAYCEKLKTLFVKTGSGILKYRITSAGLVKAGAVTLHGDLISPYYIAVCEEHLLIATSTSVQLLSVNGRMQPLLRRVRPAYIAACSSGKRFCYSENDAVICCDVEGRELFRYQHRSMKNVKGISFDRHGHLYVCAFADPKGHVHQISRDGRRGRVLIKDQGKIKRPRLVICHPTENVIVVTSYRKNVAFEVFQFSS